MKKHAVLITVFGLFIMVAFILATTITKGQAEKVGARHASPLRAGAAVGFMKIPVGSPTGGYGQRFNEGDPKSPYANKFPATNGIHTQLRIKAIVLDNGSSQINIVSMDAIGVSDYIFQRVTDKVKAKTNGKLDLSNNLVITATHTHSGPGRLTPQPATELAMDTFNPWLFNLVVDEISDVILKAHEKLVPARIGFGVGKNDEISVDRRCENPPLENPTMWVVRIDRADGTPLAVLVNFAMHGTILGGSNHYFSVDAPGLIEEKIQEKFTSPVLAVYTQSSGGDIAPSPPKPYESKWDEMEAIGESGAATAMGIYRSIKTSDKAVLNIVNLRFPLNREVLGYKGREFPYKYGAYFCGMGSQACDNDYTTRNPAMKNCPLAGKENAMLYTRLSAFRINDHFFVTLPGEPATSLWFDLKAKVEAMTGKDTAVLFGYSQDHLLYLLLPDDWWQGGYESSMNPWGWKMGEYLVDKSALLVKELVTGQKELSEDPAVEKLAVYKDRAFTPAPIGVSIQPGEVSQEAAVSADHKIASFAWFGGDSGVDYPLVLVETENNGKWNTLNRPNGLPFDNSTYETLLNYNTYPSYQDDMTSAQRKFEWQIQWHLNHPVPSALKLKAGKYRFHVKGQYYDGQGVKQHEVFSKPFEISLN